MPLPDDPCALVLKALAVVLCSRERVVRELSRPQMTLSLHHDQSQLPTRASRIDIDQGMKIPDPAQNVRCSSFRQQPTVFHENPPVLSVQKPPFRECHGEKGDQIRHF